MCRNRTTAKHKAHCNQRRNKVLRDWPRWICRLRGPTTCAPAARTLLRWPQRARGEAKCGHGWAAHHVADSLGNRQELTLQIARTAPGCAPRQTPQNSSTPHAKRVQHTAHGGGTDCKAEGAARGSAPPSLPPSSPCCLHDST